MIKCGNHATTMRRRTGLLLASALMLPLLAAGCSSDNDIDLANYVEPSERPDVLYNQGLANLNDGRMNEASKKFEAIDRQHPYSDYSRKALVMGAFADYRAAKYTEAITAAQRYLQRYPSTEDAAYAQYIIGLSYFRQIRNVTQDQKEARQTIEAMEALINQWPKSEYVEDANAKIRFARDQIAGKEMQVGRYYLERREFLAAIKRFRNVVEQFSNTRHVEEALARLTESYMALGLTSEAQTAAAVLGHNYPESQWYKDSYALLQSGGLQPREDSNSWISRAASVFRS
jgi:outer membrane protein assembly factor BamD